MRIRAVRSLDEFLGFPGDPEDLATTVSALWESGQSGPTWSFVAEEGTARKGRVGLFVEPTLPRGLAVSLGSLPEQEVRMFGLVVDWRADAWPEIGRRLLARALALRPQLPDAAQLRVNASIHSHPDRRRIVAETAGLELFQEKEGVLWETGTTSIEAPTRLRFRTLAEIGRDELVEIVARVATGTLDRNDRYYSSRMAPRDWARVYVSLFESPGTALVGYRRGEAVGFVAVSPFDEQGTATISFIGVVPEHRGNRYVDDLLHAGTRTAAAAGHSRILSDVDVENRPMLEAMERCGHRARATPWHVWHYRAAEPRVS